LPQHPSHADSRSLRLTTLTALTLIRVLFFFAFTSFFFVKKTNKQIAVSRVSAVTNSRLPCKLILRFLFSARYYISNQLQSHEVTNHGQ
jgi:hypothetical protein